MTLQHTSHSLQRNSGAGRLLRAESADGDVMQQEYDVMGWITAAAARCADEFDNV
jgi:YD repeat-containing protein